MSDVTDRLRLETGFYSIPTLHLEGESEFLDTPYASDHYVQYRFLVGPQWRFGTTTDPQSLADGTLGVQLGASFASEGGNLGSRRDGQELLAGASLHLLNRIHLGVRAGVGSSINSIDMGEGIDLPRESSLNGIFQIEGGVEHCFDSSVCLMPSVVYSRETSLAGRPDYSTEGLGFGLSLSIALTDPPPVEIAQADESIYELPADEVSTGEADNPLDRLIFFEEGSFSPTRSDDLWIIGAALAAQPDLDVLIVGHTADFSNSPVCARIESVTGYLDPFNPEGMSGLEGQASPDCEENILALRRVEGIADKLREIMARIDPTYDFAHQVHTEYESLIVGRYFYVYELDVSGESIAGPRGPLFPDPLDPRNNCVSFEPWRSE